jgi:site-specific DNA-methyltransferase (adenine-specific)
MKSKIHKGDSLEVMKRFKSNFFDSIVTDPPYGLKFMGQEWDDVIPAKEYWEEMLRVAKPGAILFSFGGTRTYHRLMVNIEDAGWFIKDCICWLDGEGFPKSLNISKAIDKQKGIKRKVIGKHPQPAHMQNVVAMGSGWQPEPDLTVATSKEAKEWDGYGTALKPAFEPIILAMKPLDGSFVENALKWGVAGLKIDECRILTEGSDKEKHLKEWERFQSKNARGNTVGDMGLHDVDLSAYVKDGRFPANLILSEQGKKELDKQTGKVDQARNENGRIGNNSDSYKASAYQFTNSKSFHFDDGGSVSRFFYCCKANKRERQGYNNHPTLKPRKLIEYLCRLSKTPTGGRVLDPFMGSGTTGIACLNTGRSFVGIEREDEYFEIAKKRLERKLEIMELQQENE